MPLFLFIGTADQSQESDNEIAAFEGESFAMEEKFSFLTASVLRSFVSRRVSRKDVVASLMGINCLKKVFDGPNQCLFRNQRTKLNSASSLEEVWIIIGEYWSFFDYYVFTQIVKLFGNQDDKQHLGEYEQKFNEYIKRRVFPITIGSGSRDDSVQYLVKLDSTYDGCEIGRLKRFQLRLSEILNLDPGILRLSQIKRGSIEMIFQIPVFVVELIFPLSISQEESLKDLQVILMQCGVYTFPSKVILVVYV